MVTESKIKSEAVSSLSNIVLVNLGLFCEYFGRLKFYRMDAADQTFKKAA